MPEIKNSFLKGKMNKDFDERLVPNGEYRDALNIEVSTSDSSDVGVVKNILGNHGLVYLQDGFTCVGSIANEKTNKLYWFVSSYDADCIIEYDIDNSIQAFVFVDKHVGTPKAVLKFPNKIITGINIIDNLLLWTDNINDPRKINIDECKSGTIDINTHTQISFDKGSFHGITLDLITGAVDASGDSTPITPGLFPFNIVTQAGERVWYERKQLDNLLGIPAVNVGVQSGEHVIKHYRGNEYLGLKNIVAFNDPNPATSTGTYFHAVDDFTSLTVIDDAWEKDDVIFGNDISIDIEERHITVIKSKPLNAPSIKMVHGEDVDSPVTIPNLFETKFPRFSYRYKYRDGEFSAFSPFTHPVFNPKYPKDTSVSNDSNIFYNKDNAYTVKEPHNKAMANSIHSIELTDFITPHTPEDVVEIEILCKQEESPIIYSIGKVKRSHKDWYKTSNHEGLGSGIGLDKSNEGTYEAKGSITKGKYIVTTENIYAALPANQLLRPWDNVPKKALAQEITGNRLVYGNYVQNYDLEEDTEISVSYNDRNNKLGSFETQGLPSVKSQRNYQLGVIYCDEHGRETPVFTSTDGAINIPWQDSGGNKNASRSLQLNASVTKNFPEWVNSLKFFIKETSNPYYNLTMDRAWVTKSTYELDDSKGNIWISFPSSDRNKISEEDYIILKKKIGVGEEQVSFENKFKIIDIKNNAPDAIKYQLVNYGTLNQTGTAASPGVATGTDDLTETIFVNTDKRIDKEVDTLTVSIGGWRSFSNSGSSLFGQLPLEEDVEQQSGPIRTTNLYISWRRSTTNDKRVSKKYKIIGGTLGTSEYTLKLATEITKIDADIAHVDGDSATTSTTVDVNGISSLHPDLIVQIEKKERKDDENFSGKFFVKISKNQVTDLIDNGNAVNILDQFQVTSKTSSWYWQDDIPSLTSQQAEVTGDGIVGDYGLLNYYGFTATHTTTDNIQHIDNNISGDKDAAEYVTAGTGDELRVTDWYKPWEGIKTKFGATFFIDSMHMAAGQSDTSNYAKYSCVTWSGCTAGEITSAEDSSWSYPPLKTWITDFEDTSGVKKKLKSNSVWFNDDLISTSRLVDPNDNWRNKRVDGWIGPLQRPFRNTPTTIEAVNANHINGLEGIVTTNAAHAIGPRRWFSGITNNATKRGVGNDTKIYSNNGEVGRHFMHLSFFAPGKDLHDGDFDNNKLDIYGPDSWASQLQGVWGGGVFTGGYKSQKFGSGSSSQKHLHLPMEGNHDSNNNYRFLAPGPGVGQGYDYKYKELHERQWDPTFGGEQDTDNKIRDFIRNLHSGARFRFNKVKTSANTGNADTEIYTIKKVSVKKLYNHTSWRKAYNRYRGTHGYKMTSTDHKDYMSVSTAALEWLSTVDASGVSSNSTKRDNFQEKIKQFGAAHNRRLCYIIELDKNPAHNPTFNPLLGTDDKMTADKASNNFCDIEFLDPVKSVLLSDLSKFPAVWEVDPKKQEVDLDIYYEASNHIPIRINDKTSELFAPVGCSVEVLNSTITGSSILESWDGSTATFSPGFPKYDVSDGPTPVETAIDYSDMSFKFIREDGSYTVAEVVSGLTLPSTGELIKVKTEFEFKENISENIITGLSWYNCFSFGNGVESNRIKDDFNAIYIANGVKASTTIQEIYEEERKAHGLIYSGIYNSNSSVNDLNQFIMAEKSTKDLNPTFGSIQKLFQRRISLIAFCEDKVVSIVSNKDTIYNADGNPQLVASDMVLGDANPFSGEYGISTNPESFAQESYRTYFTDQQRGAVLRLSKDGLTPISKTGMHDWFRDNLKEYNSLIGTYDSYKEDYNLTLSNNSFSQNIILDSFIEVGGDPISIPDATNRIENKTPNGTDFQYPYETYDILEIGNSSNPFSWDDFTTDSYNLTTSADIINHQGSVPGFAIQAGALQPAITQTYQGSVTPAEPVTFGGGSVTGFNAVLSNSGTTTNGEIISSDLTTIDFGNQSTTTDKADFTGVQINPNIESVITPYNGGGTVYTANNIWYPISSSLPLSTSLNSTVSKKIQYTPSPNGIYFNRNTAPGVYPNNSYIDFSNFGTNGTGNLVDSYLAGGNLDDPTNNYAANENTSNVTHDSCFAGDEIHVQIKLECYNTPKGDGWNATTSNEIKARYGRNFIQPKISLLDGSSVIGSTITQDSAVMHPNITGSSYYGSNIGYLPTATELANGDINADWDGTGVFRDSTTADITPYNCFHSTPFSGVDGDQGTSASTVSTGSMAGFSAPLNFVEPKGWQGDAYAEFPNTFTHGQTNIQHRFFILGPAGYPHVGGELKREYTISFSIKLKEYGMSDNDALTYDPFGPVKKVVDNLKVRLQNTLSTITTNWYHGYWNKLRHPLWKVKDVKIVKGFSVLQANQPEINTTSIDTVGVAPVPPVDIPAWTEINHNYFSLPSQTWSVIPDAIGSSNTYITEGDTNTIFGDNRGSSIASGVDASGNTIEYSLPEGFSFTHDGTEDAQNNATLWETSDYTITDTYSGTPGAVAQAVIPDFDRTAWSANSYSLTQTSHNNSYIEIISDSSTSATDINHGITIEPWVANSWYLVDVEIDHTYNTNAGTGGLNGDVLILDVASTNSFDDGEDISINGIGKYAGDATNSHCKLIQITRTEYAGTSLGAGDGKVVLRGIFQFASDSYLYNNSLLDTFKLRVIGCENGIKIKRIITKQLNELPSTGSVSNWLSTQQSTYNAAHSFSNNSLYYKSNKLVWEVPANPSGIFSHNKWTQDIVTPENIYETIWNFSFTISENPITNNFSGSVGGSIGVFVNGIFRSFAFKNITQTGEYLIVFDLNTTQNTSNWKAYRENLNTPVTTASLVYSGATLETALAAGWFAANAGNKIQFYHEIGTSVVTAQEFAISNINLTPLDNIFLAGSIGAWEISGFDTSTYDYIRLDNANNNFVFDDCPVEGNTHQFPNIAQQINKIIKKDEYYEISFTHEIASGEIGVYYYNNEGDGFKITGIGGATPGQPVNFLQTVRIGESSWSSTQDNQPIASANDYSAFDSDFKNSFVIVARNDGAGNDVEGFIDNISMIEVFVSEETADKTITFNEAVNGWSSFKSFVPESGVSLSKKYFTFKNGGLWQHYVPKQSEELGYTSNDFFIKYTAEEADNYNVFYDVLSNSKLEMVINQEPSTVKIFNTINYEGSQAHIIEPMVESEITINNASAWGVANGISGWKCSEIKTDLDVGSVTEFIKKEGKWFNYIKGLNTSQAIDTSRFSVQGVGIINSAASVTFTGGSASGVGAGTGTGTGTGTGNGGGGGTGGGTGGGIGGGY